MGRYLRRYPVAGVAFEAPNTCKQHTPHITAICGGAVLFSCWQPQLISSPTNSMGISTTTVRSGSDQPTLPDKPRRALHQPLPLLEQCVSEGGLGQLGWLGALLVECRLAAMAACTIQLNCSALLKQCRAPANVDFSWRRCESSTPNKCLNSAVAREHCLQTY